jgi:zinc protease
MTLDRTLMPDFQAVKQINIPQLEIRTLSNGIPLYIINAGEQPVLKIELSFDAGAWHDTQNGISMFTAKMLGEGTSKRSSQEISEYFDQFGAFSENGHGLDRANLTVYSLSKHLHKVLPMVQEILSDATFPENEVENFKNIQLQTLKVNQEKSAFVAGQILRKNIFGENHPYGNYLTEEAIAEISRQNILDFYQQNWQGKTFRIFLSGKVSEQDIDLVETFLGKENFTKTSHNQSFSEIINTEKSILIEKPKAMQSSIRLGKVMMRRTDPDYFKMLLLNEVFGGYFGSRLMKNIREEKGLTYGISSNVAPFAQTGYFIVGTDVKKANTQQTLDEIHKEITILQTKLVPADELQTVKNYMAGSFAGSLATPFDIADRYKVVVGEKLPVDFYEQYIPKILEVTDIDILETANKYLQIDSLTEVVVGGK